MSLQHSIFPEVYTIQIYQYHIICYKRFITNTTSIYQSQSLDEKVTFSLCLLFGINGGLVEISPLCVLDFYVVEGHQRGGLGRQLFDQMLSKEDVKPERLGYDRPSPKLIGFLRQGRQGERVWMGNTQLQWVLQCLSNIYRVLIFFYI